MDLIAWILLLTLLALWLRLRHRVGQLELRIDLLLRSAAPATAIPAAPLAPMPEPAVAERPQPAMPSPPPPEAVAAPPPVREPAPIPVLPAVQRPAAVKRGLGFEDIFGRYLPIWAGGITLIVAGVLIVKYSIDAGLLSPAVRVVAGMVFGGALIAGAEAALRAERLVRDARVAQSLAGAGVATLYAAILVATHLYHLIPSGSAFAGLVAVTLLAAGLSLRFGAPSAVLGLVGGLAAPALVGAQSPNVPLLATYLAFIVGGLAALGRAQRRPWLGAFAILGGFLWNLLLVLGGAHGSDAALAAGLFTLLLAIGFPLLLTGPTSSLARLAAAIVGCVQMAALVATGGFAGLDWALYGLIAAALVWLSRRQPLLADAPLAGIAVGLILTLLWQAPDGALLAAVLAGGALIHAGPALVRLWRSDGRLGDAAQIAAAAIGIAGVPFAHFHGIASDWQLAALALTGAALASGAAALGWHRPARTADARFAMLSLTTVALGLMAAALVTPQTAWSPITAVAALLTLLLARRAGDTRVETGAQALAALALMLLPSLPVDHALLQAVGIAHPLPNFADLARWAVVALAAIGFARESSAALVRYLAAGAAAALGYVAVAQLVPVAGLPLVPAATLAALALVPLRDTRRAAALGVTGAIAAGWAIEPLLVWLAAGGAALAGAPLLVRLPAPSVALIHLGAPALALGLTLWRRAEPKGTRAALIGVAATLGVITLHIYWKQLFAITTPEAFAAWGMAERSLWEMLLLGAAFGAMRLAWTRTALALAGASLAHFLWFTLVVHDPLWATQAVGPWLLPAYACAWAAAAMIVRLCDRPVARRIETGVRIALILFFAASALRQLFHGSMLSAGPVLQAEDIGRSLLAIAIALGFLRWGIAHGDRDWRIASLVLMLTAVGKVFLFDAAGLEGLLRIGSFVALGFSLILVGWIYSRFLPDAHVTGTLDAAENIDDHTRG